jgi:hypothetical protein
MPASAARAACVLPFLLAVASWGGCSSQQKKLADPNGSVLDNLVYGTLGLDRDTTYYYRVVTNSHTPGDFRYRRSEDRFLVDKNVDAVQRLGQARYARLEGEAQVIALLMNVLHKDPSSLARAHGANSLTRLAAKLPAYRSAGPVERGGRFLALLQELDGLHAAGGAATTNPAWARRRTVALLRALGDLDIQDARLAQSALKPFITRDYLIDATDRDVREASDTALVKRMGQAARLALRDGVNDPVAFVREESIRGLKTLDDRSAEPVVLARLRVESDVRVRAEAVEYLGRGAGPDAVEALLARLEDGDPSVAYKAREALTRIAGRDLGFRRATWTRWAEARYPQLARGRAGPAPRAHPAARPPQRAGGSGP